MPDKKKTDVYIIIGAIIALIALSIVVFHIDVLLTQTTAAKLNAVKANLSSVDDFFAAARIEEKLQSKKVIIIEFLDFQCPVCAQAPNLEEELSGDDVGVVLRHFPLRSMHANAYSAAIAYECAKQKGVEPEYRELLFGYQSKLSTQTYLTLATQLGLSADEFTACLSSEDVKVTVAQDISLASRFGVIGTPSYLIISLQNVSKQMLITGLVPVDEIRRDVNSVMG